MRARSLTNPGTLSSLSGTVPISGGGTGQTTATAAFNALDPLTTQGDILYHNGTNSVRLAKGTATQVLAMNAAATAPEWTNRVWMTLLSSGDANGLNPADATTYYWGKWAIFEPDSTYATHSITVQQACTLTDVMITCIIAGTLGTTGQNGTYSIRKNNTTDTEIGTSDFDASFGVTGNALNVSLAAGDTFALKLLTPTWTTNPTIVYHTAEVWFKQ